MKNEQLYFLDLPTLLAILSRQKRSGTVSVQQIRIAGIRGKADAFLGMEYGVVAHCQLIQKEKILFVGNQAYQLLLSMPALEWRWRSTSSVESSATSLSPSLAQKTKEYPQQTRKVQMGQSSLPHLQRKIILLCDGTRSVQRIASLLLLPHEELVLHLYTLEADGYIYFLSQ